MEKTVRVAEVRTFQTKSGNTRFVLRDEDGSEYTTFRDEIGRTALAAEGRRARIECHEETRNGFLNVYLDRVEPLGDADESERDGEDVDEVAWRTAVESAPWLVGREREVPADELFEKLQPFKDLVADDIRDGREDD
jgi:hypothetical protein